MKKLKKLMEFIAICMTIYILSYVLRNQELINMINNITKEKVLIVLSILAVFLIVHIVRMCRIYILLIEEKMPLKKFIKLYLKTTFVNNVIPFKLGEFYKMLSYGKDLKSLSAGLSLVWLDRFFDSLILIVLISIASGFNIFSPIYIILMAFILFSILAYVSFESTYKYFNRLVLEKGTSKRSKLYLEGIEEMKKVYKKAKDMLRFRGALLIMLSIIIWAFEYLLAYLTFSMLFNINFGLSIFNDYINGIFMLFNTRYSTISYFNLIIMAVVFIVMYITLIVTRKEAKNG